MNAVRRYFLFLRKSEFANLRLVHEQALKWMRILNRDEHITGERETEEVLAVSKIDKNQIEQQYRPDQSLLNNRLPLRFTRNMDKKLQKVNVRSARAGGARTRSLKESFDTTTAAALLANSKIKRSSQGASSR
jgi:hypothetical protein